MGRPVMKSDFTKAMTFVQYQAVTSPVCEVTAWYSVLNKALLKNQLVMPKAANISSSCFSSAAMFIYSIG